MKHKLLQASRRRWLVLLGSTFLFALFINLANRLLDGSIWQSFEIEKDIELFFCEYTDLALFIRQPLNTFSNIVYLIGAIVVLRIGWKDQRKDKHYNMVTANPFYSISYGIILFFIFTCSTFFHSSLVHVASELDFSAVYSLSLFPLMYFTHRVWILVRGLPSNERHTRETTILITIFSSLYLLMTFGLMEGYRNYVVLGIILTMIAFGIIVERKDPGRTNQRYLITCIATILFAVNWFTIDVFHVDFFCDPQSWIQPHSLWHLFSGIAAFYFYMYIRSEHNRI